MADVKIEPLGPEVEGLPVVTVSWTDVASGTRMAMSDVVIRRPDSYVGGYIKPYVSVRLAEPGIPGLFAAIRLGRVSLGSEHPEDIDVSLPVALVCEYVRPGQSVHVVTDGSYVDVIPKHQYDGVTPVQLSEHRSLCDLGSRKAWFRATRELCGISQQDVADEADVRVLTVKRWERLDGPEPPEDVCRWLLDALEDHDSAVDELCAAHVSGSGPVAALALFRTQEECDRAFGGTEGADVPFGYRNAIARSAAERLTRMGFPVRWRYADEDGASTCLLGLS